MVPATVMIMTRDEQANIENCLKSLSEFDEIIVVDSASTDKTCEIARECGAHVVPFEWDGTYPKKRQWALENIETHHDWIFFVDADEIIPQTVTEEIKSVLAVPNGFAGFFVVSDYCINGRMTRFGLKNKKLALLNKRDMCFPVVDDLDCAGMGEIEGHYQPVLRTRAKHGDIGVLSSRMVHDIILDKDWREKHTRYAQWASCVERRRVLPQDPVKIRRMLKAMFVKMPCRACIAFLHSFVLKLGFLDGYAGFLLAKSRYDYYRLIARENSRNA